MADSYTFSALIKAVRSSSGMGIETAGAVQLARNRLTKCHRLGQFARDLVEELLVVPAPVDGVYRIQLDAFLFGSIHVLAHQAPEIARRDYGRFVRVTPADITAGNAPRYFYYLSGNSLILGGVSEGDVLFYAWLARPRAFVFYPDEAQAPATYNADTGVWSYSSANLTVEEQLAAQARVTDWVLQRHFDVVLDGVLATMYKEDNDPRGAAAYARYKQGEEDIRESNEIVMQPMPVALKGRG